MILDKLENAPRYFALSPDLKVVMTYLRGRLIMGDGIYLGLNGDGKFLRAKR